MDNWDPDGHDGSRDGHRYFQCKPGYGKWIRTKKMRAYFDKKPVIHKKICGGKKSNLWEKIQEIEQKEQQKKLVDFENKKKKKTSNCSNDSVISWKASN